MASGVMFSAPLFTGASLWPFSYFSLLVTTTTSASASPPLIPALAPTAPRMSFRSSLFWAMVMAPRLSVRIRMAPFVILPRTLLF